MSTLIRSVLVGVLCSTAAVAVAETPTASLSELGLALEKATAAVGDARLEALQALTGEVDRLFDADLDEESELAGLLLSAEIWLELSEPARAHQRYEDGRKKAEGSPLDDDVLFGRTLALERMGRDADAHELWVEWESRFGKSSLAGDAGLRRMWNELRRGDLTAATTTRERILESAPWLQSDPRMAVAAAALMLLLDRPGEALDLLGDDIGGAPATYLRALCLAQSDQPLKAAGFFQELVERHPESTLRDHAMLAKANTFLGARAYRSAVEEFQRVLDEAHQPQVRAEASLRHATAVFLDGEFDGAEMLLRGVEERHRATDVGARAQFLLGEVMVAQERYEDAILEFNRVLTNYFEHSVAASAQYRVGRAMDALDRPLDATGAYQAVVAGYPLEPEAPAAAYLAGVGLLGRGKPMAAANFFQIVLDRYTRSEAADGTVVFAHPEHQELTEAALCLLEYSYHQAGNLGQLSGAPHLLLRKLPASTSPWRAYSLIIDADAMAAQGRHDDAQTSLKSLIELFPEHPTMPAAYQLLAWSYAQQGNQDLAIQTEEAMLRRFAKLATPEQRATAYLHMAHVRFNQKDYEDAVALYARFLEEGTGGRDRLLSLYQQALCYQRLGQTGDAADRLETLLGEAPGAEIAEVAWVRAGDIYFNAHHYEDAARCYRGLLDNFAQSASAATGLLRLAQCAYNAGDNGAAIEHYSGVMERFPYSPEAKAAEQGLEQALYQMGQTGGVEDLARLVEQYPGSTFAADAQFQIAQHAYDAGDHSRAAEEFRRVVSQFPSYSAADRAQFLMADSYARGGEADRARLAFEQFLTFFADSDLQSDVLFRLGGLYFDQQDLMQAGVHFARVMEADASQELTAAALFNLALCHRSLGDLAQAQAELEQYRSTYGDDKRALDVAIELAALHEASGNTSEAVTEYETALEMEPEESLRLELLFRLGSGREALGKKNAALFAYETALASKTWRDPWRLSSVARCAAIYEEKERWGQAKWAYRDLAKFSDDPELAAAAKARAKQLESFAR